MKTRTIAVQVSEETHTLFRCLRAATGVNSATLIARALEAYTPAPRELSTDVREDVGHLLTPGVVTTTFSFETPVDQADAIDTSAEVEAPVVEPISQPTEDIDELLAGFGFSPDGVAGNPFPT